MLKNSSFSHTYQNNLLLLEFWQIVSKKVVYAIPVINKVLKKYNNYDICKLRENTFGY